MPGEISEKKPLVQNDDAEAAQYSHASFDVTVEQLQEIVRQRNMDEFTKTGVLVVCAGAKAILDLPLTLEYLETKGVNVVGYRTDELPAFYTRRSGLKVTWRMDSAEEIASSWLVQKELYPNTGLLVTNPIPEEYSMDADYINREIDEAIKEMKALGIKGKETTPYLLDKIQKLTGGKSLEANIKLVLNNAALASRIAVATKK